MNFGNRWLVVYVMASSGCWKTRKLDESVGNLKSNVVRGAVVDLGKLRGLDWMNVVLGHLLD